MLKYKMAQAKQGEKMNKTANTLLIIGGVLAVLAVIGGIVTTIIMFGIVNAANNPEIVAQVKEVIKNSYPEYTAAQIDAVYAKVQEICNAMAYIQLVEVIITFVAAIEAFVAAKMQHTGLYIAAIVLGVLSINIFTLIGGIIGVVKRNQQPVEA